MTGDRKGPLGPVAFTVVFTSVMAMLFSGGCTLIFLADFGLPFLTDGGSFRNFVLVVGGVPFMLSVLAFWLAWTYGRGSAPSEDSQNGGAS